MSVLVPDSGTNINIYTNIPWQNDYKNLRWFGSQTEQQNWFANQPKDWFTTKVVFQRTSAGASFKANAPIDVFRPASYMSFQNANYSGRWFYAFITEIEYVNSNVTRIHFEIDVFQTYWFDVSFKTSFVLREHQTMWNTDGTPVINTQDEGLYYGSELNTVYIDRYLPFPSRLFLVVVSKTTMDSQNTTGMIIPQVNGAIQPLTYYVLPMDLQGGAVPCSVGGTTVATSDAGVLLNQLYTNTSAVNDVVSLYITEYPGLNITDTSGNLDFSSSEVQQATIGNANCLYVKNVPSYTTMTIDLGSKYNGYESMDESKLYMYPYTVSILDDLRGNRVVLKNEYMYGVSPTVQVMGSLGTENKVTYSLISYLLEHDAASSDYSFAVATEHGLINDNPNDVAILSDYLSAYLQGHKNQLRNTKATIHFNETMNEVTNGISAIGGAASSMMPNMNFNPLAAATDLAMGAANAVKTAGDARLAIQQIQAKKKDLANIPPQVAKMGSNSAFDYGNGIYGIFLIKKQITGEYQRKLGDYFKMYGYKTNEVKIPNFDTRQSWNYIETEGCTITGALANSILNKMKSIFDNGTTIWHTDDIGNYSLANGVI